MEFSKMTVEELEARKAAIGAEVDAEGADLDALEAEVKGINAELEARRAAAAKRNEIRNSVAMGAGVTFIDTPKDGRTVKTVEEIRASKEYIDAYVKYMKTNDPTECRALLTTNSDIQDNPGQVPVPTIVETRIRTAWERSGILDEVTRTYIKGNVAVGFELSASDATVHKEGDNAPDEEELLLGVVTLIPQTIKKWIRISDEVYELGGEAFLNYIYDEITNKIISYVRNTVVSIIAGASDTSNATTIGVPQVDGAPTLDAIATAAGYLSDDATNLSVTINRLTHAAFIAAIAQNGYLFDPFQGYRVHYSSALPAYEDAQEDDVWMIVGDYKGITCNFPAGDGVKLKFDDLTEAEADLIKIVGRILVAIGITEPGRFVNVTKAGE